MANNNNNLIIGGILIAGGIFAVYYFTKKTGTGSTSNTATSNTSTGTSNNTAPAKKPTPVYYSTFPIKYGAPANDYVKGIQIALGFTGADVDGIIGPKTLAALNAQDPTDSPNGNVWDTSLIIPDLPAVQKLTNDITDYYAQ